MKRVISRRSSLLVLLILCALASTVCGSSGSPTSPTPSGEFAAQFDSLWTTFDREYSYFVHKQIDWHALRNAHRPRAIAAADQNAFIGIVREMLEQLHDLHVTLRDPAGTVLPTYEPQWSVNWDRTVWEQYVRRANWFESLVIPRHRACEDGVFRLLTSRFATNSWIRRGESRLLRLATHAKTSRLWAARPRGGTCRPLTARRRHP